MKTTWRYHRPHAIANLAFRLATVAGFGAGLLYACTRTVPRAPSCDIQLASCVWHLVRYEAVFHVAPPVAGLIAGVMIGSWLARAVHRYHRSARTA
jgi:hypothetical protein